MCEKYAKRKWKDIEKGIEKEREGEHRKRSEAGVMLKIRAREE